MTRIFGYLKGDRVIWMVVLLLSIISVLVVYSSSNALAQKFKAGNTEAYLIKHSMFIVFGVLLMYFVHRINYKYLSRISQIAFIISIPLLAFTLLKGVSAGGASRWLEIPGIGLTFQTSDFAKIALIIYVARTLTVKQDQLDDFKVIIKSLLIPISLVCILILPANFSTAALIFVTCLLILFVGRVPIRSILKILAGCVIVGTLFFSWVWFAPETIPGGRGTTWKARIEAFLSGDAETNYQSEQAKIAVAKGGAFGLGPGNSTTKNFLPQSASDFIFAIIIEEYGSFVGVLLLFLYMILFFRSIRILRSSEKTFGGLLAVGLSFSLVFQALINMAVAVNLFPVTGQPLPMVSMGGTSIWITCITIGIILSISKEAENNESEKEVLPEAI
ncbi:MAG: cell division protein FtsW [Bacteroidetes bacterium]|nr:cell division protein FtsW [Bacteroidota bacterium]